MCKILEKTQAYSWSTAGGAGLVLEIPANGREVVVRFNMRQPIDRCSAIEMQKNFLAFLMVERGWCGVSVKNALNAGIGSVAVAVSFDVKPTHAETRLLALCAQKFASTISGFTPPSREKVLELFSQRPTMQKQDSLESLGVKTALNEPQSATRQMVGWP